VQLLLVGLVLRTVFDLQSPWLVAAVLAAMFVTASYEILLRQERRFVGLWRAGIGAGTTLLATLFVTGFALLTLRPEPWFSPQVVIPLAGIVLGNVMNGVSISLNAFNTSLVRERAAIEARLALGATRYEALKAMQRSALRSGMIPIINQMSAAGIVTLPGMMTGQILAGMAPLDAAKYQILILLPALWRCGARRSRDDGGRRMAGDRRARPAAARPLGVTLGATGRPPRATPSSPNVL